MVARDYSDTPIDQLISLKGKTAVVTGGARGISFAIAKRLTEAGANVLIADIDVGNCLGRCSIGAAKSQRKSDWLKARYEKGQGYGTRC